MSYSAQDLITYLLFKCFKKKNQKKIYPLKPNAVTSNRHSRFFLNASFHGIHSEFVVNNNMKRLVKMGFYLDKYTAHVIKPLNLGLCLFNELQLIKGSRPYHNSLGHEVYLCCFFCN